MNVSLVVSIFDSDHRPAWILRSVLVRPVQQVGVEEKYGLWLDPDKDVSAEVLKKE